MADGITTGDLALMKEHDGFGGSGLMFFIGILIILGLMGGGFGGGNRGYQPDFVTQAEMTAGFNNAAVQNQLQANLLASNNNNYETAQLIHQQSTEMLQQNNTNLINAIQGFNNLGMQLTNQTNTLAAQISSMQAKMDECCCSIKTQMLQQELDNERRRNTEQFAEISNLKQSQNLLASMGRWVGWAGSGSQGAAAAAG